MKYTTYNQNTGQILSIIEITNDQSYQDNLSDKHFIEGGYQESNFYVDTTTKTIVNKPACPGTNYTWDWESKTWSLDVAQQTITQRLQRDILLSAVDRVNAIWYASLTADEQQELIAYRQALLAVPQQQDFPATITWPTKPVWL